VAAVDRSSEKASASGNYQPQERSLYEHISPPSCAWRLAMDGGGCVGRVNADGEVVCCHRQMANLRQSSVSYPFKCSQLRHSSYGN
jgi:hypothetical protein